MHIAYRDGNWMANNDVMLNNEITIFYLLPHRVVFSGHDGECNSLSNQVWPPQSRHDVAFKNDSQIAKHALISSARLTWRYAS